MIVKGARVFSESGGFEERNIFIDGEFISGDAGGDVVDASGCTAIPGLIDLHLHGCVGREFTSADENGVRAMMEYEASNGVTALCPTTLTLAEETLAAACGVFSRSAANSISKGSSIVGIYLEGPFISAQKLGAQNPDYVRLPNAALYRRLQETAGGLIKVLTIAPEIEGALDVIAELKDEVVISLAHTTADYETASEAYYRGARQATHLYNAMPAFHHRAPGVIGAAFDAPHCRVELICDGIHIHPSAVRATFAMFGDDRVLMISDSMMATGLEDGDYEMGGLAVTVRDRMATLTHGGAIAGSATNLMGCLRTAVRDMGIPLHTAVKCASVNPARAIGLFGERGSLDPGKYADVVLLDNELAIRGVILRGHRLNDTQTQTS
ncbi:MAG: N-acetylglucosamine-6-phosphate deacetylase [Synergistaceae bacterium]|jgi:N-acetylglucosamine-6-phosphate deacetylase|nr:N-acetylglucosamine-6-phosphate deacetylase [Synergistaceae bacterium]